MKFTLGWLKEHLDTTADADAVSDKLTAVGLEVEGVADRAKDLAPFIVAHVREASRHPNADKLQVCMVDTGSEVLQVVCGAPNAHAGMKGVFAPSGTTIPATGLVLKKTAIRGVESNGMLCSERELGLGTDHNGIIELPADAPIGAPFAKVMGLDDPVIEIAITPNRQDCLGVHGVARDLAAAGLGTLKPLKSVTVPGRFKSPIGVSLDLPSDPAACPMFVGRYVRGVKNGPSPAWLQDRLKAIGLRPISTLVDITNFFTFDRSRPLHVFDADKVTGTIRARLAQPGETLLALNGNEYTLTGDETVIADDSAALGLGGVIGGESTGVGDGTVNVFIEAALFDPIRTARTGRRHGIDSDARYRFERGIDPEAVLSGMEAATQMVLDLCGGEASELVVAGTVPDWKRDIAFRPERVQQLAGLAMDEAEATRILHALGFQVDAADYLKLAALKVSVPSWRRDVHGEADLVEEVARIKGFEAIPAVPLTRDTVVARPAVTPEQARRARAKRLLADRGLMECVTWSFLPRAQAELFGGGQDSLRLANPISADLDTMRPSMLPNLIAAAGRNVDRGFTTVALFEVGPQYAGDAPEDQALVAAGIRRGQTGPRHWNAPPRDADLYDVKGDVMALLADLGVPADKVQIVAGAADWYHPGRSGTVQLGPKTILARFGDIHPRVLTAMDVKGPLVAFEVFLDAVPRAKAKTSRSRGSLRASDLPAVERDFAFVVDATVPAADLVRAARGADKVLIEDARVFDVFAGGSLGEGRKSLALSIRLQPTERTLTDDEIAAVAQKVIAAVTKATGATLRS